MSAVPYYNISLAIQKQIISDKETGFRVLDWKGFSQKYFSNILSWHNPKHNHYLLYNGIAIIYTRPTVESIGLPDEADIIYLN